MQRQDEALLLITGNYKRTIITYYERGCAFFIPVYDEDALWWLQDKMFFKLCGKSGSSGAAGVRGSPPLSPHLQ